MPKKTKKRVVAKKTVNRSVINKPVPSKPNNQSTGNGFGIAGLVMGILSILLFFMPIFSILGLIFSIVQMKRKSNGYSIAGLILSIIGLVFFLIMVIGLIIFLSTFNPAVMN